MNNKEKKKHENNKHLVDIIKTILLIVSVILIMLIINIVIEKADIPNIDITKEKLYSLSDETKDKIKNIENNIKILTYEMNNFPEIINFIKLYTKENKNITYEEINDITLKPNLQQKFGLGISIKEPAIIIESENNNKMILAKDMYGYNNYTYQQYDLTEEIITNGIIDVNLKEHPTIYFFKNHIEKNTTYNLMRNLLENESNKIKDLDLLVEGKVPDDCMVLVITSLEEDISKYERDLIENYINKAGNLLVLQAPHIKNKNEFENFNYILDLYGAKIDEGILIENDLQRMIYGYKNIIIPNVNFNSEISNEILKKGQVALLNSGTIKFNDEKIEKLCIKKEDLILTTSSCKRERNDIEEVNSNEIVEQDIPIISVLSKPVNNNKESKIIICASNLSFSDMIMDLNKNGINQSDNQILMLQLYNNKDFLINTISYLTNRTDNLTLRKDTGVVTFLPTEKQNIIIKIILIILPLSIIIFGIIIWQIRRKK